MDQSHSTALGLPIELLFEIVKESIALPEFLDVNHVPEFNSPLAPPTTRIGQYQNEDIYYRTERHINVLRRVCSFFDAYLRPFENRYVHVTDLYHGYLPKVVALKAIRLNLSPICFKFGLYGQCDDCWPGRLSRDLTSFLSALPDEKFAAEIITGSHDMFSRLASNFPPIMYSRLPKLKAIFNVRIGQNKSRMLAFDSADTPQLQFLRINAITDRFSELSFTAQNLTTFEYLNEQEPIPPWMAQESCRAQLPALQHLRFLATVNCGFLSLDGLLAVLKIFGQQLLSLRIRGRGSDASDTVLPAEYLELCPRLERIDTALSLEAFLLPDHPLHTVSVFVPDVYGILPQYLEPFQMHFLDQIPDRSCLQRIILTCGWDALSRSISISNKDGAKALEWIRKCAGGCEKKGVRLEDGYGVAFESSGLACLSLAL